jgi:nucleoside-diphosphate-sugar epimerase
MHVALTGVSGFIGSIMARQLHQAGHSVTGLVRASSRRDHIETYVDRFVVGEQDDDRFWPALLEGTDCVIHNSVDWKSPRAGEIDKHLQSNLVGTLRFLRASAPRQFIYISSVAVHHDMRPGWNGLIDEDHPTRPSSWYGALKAAVEAHLWAAHFGEGRHTCALRPSGVYGIDPDLPRSHGYPLVQSIKAGQPCTKLGGGKFVHVDDVAAAAVNAVGNPVANGRVIDLTDCYARWADWAAMIAEILEVNVPIDFSSPSQPRNMFVKDGAHSLGVSLDRGHDGIRTYLRELVGVMQRERQLIA